MALHQTSESSVDSHGSRDHSMPLSAQYVMHSDHGGLNFGIQVVIAACSQRSRYVIHELKCIVKFKSVLPFEIFGIIVAAGHK